MKYNFDKSRVGMLIFLGVALVALWLLVAYGFYKESERAKYDVTVSPGAVTYGTHSTALMPVSAAPMRHTLPMLSGAVIRSYAHGGHASMPAAATKQGQIYTTSSAKVKSIGSGAGSGSVYTSVGSSNRSSSRGIQYGGGSVTMPSIAMVSTASVTHAEKASHFMAGIRKAKPSETGSDGEYRDGGEGDLWTWNGEEWIQVKYGDKRIYMNETYYWNGITWVPANEWDPEGVPVGPTPWILMLLLAAMYIVVAKRKNEKEFC